MTSPWPEIELRRILRLLAYATPVAADAAYQATISIANEHGPLRDKWLKIELFHRDSYLHFPGDREGRFYETRPSFAPPEITSTYIANDSNGFLITRLRQIRLEMDSDLSLQSYLLAVEAILRTSSAAPGAESENLPEIIQTYRLAVASMSPRFYVIFTGRLRDIWQTQLASYGRYETLGATVAATMGLMMIWEGLTRLDEQLDAAHWYRLFQKINSSIGAAERGVVSSTAALLHYVRDELLHDSDPSIQNLGRALLFGAGTQMNSIGDSYLKEAKHASTLETFYQTLFFSVQFFLSTISSLPNASAEGVGAEDLVRVARVADEKFARVAASLLWAVFELYVPDACERLLSEDSRAANRVMVDIFDNQFLYPQYMREELGRRLNSIRQGASTTLPP